MLNFTPNNILSVDEGGTLFRIISILKISLSALFLLVDGNPPQIRMGANTVYMLATIRTC